MANLWQHVSAFFDPTIAVNKDGHLVNSGGFFDSGSDSMDYLDPNTLSDVREFFYGEPSEGFGSGDYRDGFNSPITSGNDLSVENIDSTVAAFDQALNSAAQQQQESAQTSADTAMDFEERMFDKYVEVQRQLADEAWNREMEASNSSYQRAMRDLQSAGINPKLVAKLGGASTPSYDVSATYQPRGSSASMQMANISSLAQVLSSYITGADALDRNQNDFVKGIITTLIPILFAS